MPPFRTIVVAAVLALSPLFGSTAFPADEQIVQQVSANGTRNLRPFTVKDNWELRWTNQKGINISIYNPDGKLQGNGGSSMKPGEGSSFQPKGGTYYLEITSMGEWTVTVVQLP